MKFIFMHHKNSLYDSHNCLSFIIFFCQCFSEFYLFIWWDSLFLYYIFIRTDDDTRILSTTVCLFHFSSSNLSNAWMLPFYFMNLITIQIYNQNDKAPCSKSKTCICSKWTTTNTKLNSLSQWSKAWMLYNSSSVFTFA